MIQWRPKQEEAQKARHYGEVRSAFAEKVERGGKGAYGGIDRLVALHVTILAGTVMGLAECYAGDAAGDDAYCRSMSK